MAVIHSSELRVLSFFFLRSVDELGLIREVSHSFLGKGGADNVSGGVLHRFIVTRWNPLAAMDVEAGMPP